MFAINCIECAFLKLRWSPRKIKKSLFKHKSLKYFPGAICYPTNLPNASNDTAVISSISKSPQFHRKCRYALTLLWYIDNIVNIHSHSTIAFLHQLMAVGTQGDRRVMAIQVVEFSRGDTKLEIFLPKNQHTQRKLLNFENWCNGEVSKSALFWLLKSIFHVKSHKNLSQFFFHWRISIYEHIFCYWHFLITSTK